MTKFFVVVTRQQAPLSKDNLLHLKKNGQAKIYGPYSAEQIIAFKNKGKVKPETIIYVENAEYAENFSSVYPQIVKARNDAALEAATGDRPAPQPTSQPTAASTYSYPQYEHKSGSKKGLIFLLLLLLVGAGAVYKFFFMPKAWPDIYVASKEAIVRIKVEDSTGSGFFIGDGGLIITNSHVIESETDIDPAIKVIDAKGKEHSAYIVKRGYDPLDITLLKIEGRGNPTLDFADDKDCSIGDELIAIGAPLGLELSMTKGVVSSCDRDNSGISLLQTDTPINPGNSGGPLINKYGKVIAVSTLKVSMEGVDGLNFAIKASVVDDFINNRLDKQNETFAAEHRKQLEEDKEIRAFILEVYNEIHDIYRNEFRAYSFNLNRQVSKGLIGRDRANVLMEDKKVPPAGYADIDDWVQSLTKRYVKEELTEAQVTNLISRHFVD